VRCFVLGRAARRNHLSASTESCGMPADQGNADAQMKLGFTYITGPAATVAPLSVCLGASYNLGVCSEED